MPITSDHIRETIAAYLEGHPQDGPAMSVPLVLLEEVDDLTNRKEYRGHVTAGAVLTNPSGRVLFIHHLALDKWLLPGGHVEDDDPNLMHAALRELEEETGICPENVTPVSDVPVHIDVHPIPANEDKGEDAHLHIDFRFMFTTVSDVAELQAEEVTDSSWRGIETIADVDLRARVAAVHR
ncbi:NUDIX hydrolase [Streptacidiphilus cavernicola]|uniref:NUDIX hydrolase n=1 Tax=Streptacidiphilus cavernicola TaxID=3342716 RepID=A0ABV6VXM1_9ACTN